jgi:outer membrane biosynthesis protein TonB
MSRIGLAFSSFFRLLFGKKLSPAVADYLPPEVARLPAGDAPPPKAAKPEPKPEAKPEPKPEAKPEPKPEPVAKKVDLSAAQRDGALALLALLQRDGRLVDFCASRSTASPTPTSAPPRATCTAAARRSSISTSRSSRCCPAPMTPR